jgi:hypothetical protein
MGGTAHAPVVRSRGRLQERGTAIGEVLLLPRGSDTRGSPDPAPPESAASHASCTLGVREVCRSRAAEVRPPSAPNEHQGVPQNAMDRRMGSCSESSRVKARAGGRGC